MTTPRSRPTKLSASLRPASGTAPRPRKSAAGLSIEELELTLGRGARARRILKGISFDVPGGSITGLAGESGSGKTLTGMSILGLQPPGSVMGGRITYAGENLLSQPAKRMNALRGNEISMIFQDPSSALHPMLGIDAQLTDHYRHHTGASRGKARARATELLERVRVPDPAGALRKYPHQFSGGQLQRIAIASALMCEPSVLVADEPTTALDVTVQAGILHLLRELCDDLGLAVLLVTHDLGVMSALADRVVVLRDGTVVEQGEREQVICAPRSDYTRELIEALPGAQVARDDARGAEERGHD